MYNIFVNEHRLLLKQHPVESKDIKSYRYLGKPKFLYPYIDRLEKTPRHVNVDTCIYFEDLNRLWDDFTNIYKLIDAAGGLVVRNDGKILAIYRLGWWDLPKGKIDPGESIKEAAVREVKEETNIEGSLLDQLRPSYHTYRSKKEKRILKTTYWFVIATENPENVVLQQEEGIHQYQWLDPKNFMEMKPLYRSIASVVDQYRSNNQQD